MDSENEQEQPPTETTDAEAIGDVEAQPELETPADIITVEEPKSEQPPEETPEVPQTEIPEAEVPVEEPKPEEPVEVPVVSEPTQEPPAEVPAVPLSQKGSAESSINAVVTAEERPAEESGQPKDEVTEIEPETVGTEPTKDEPSDIQPADLPEGEPADVEDKPADVEQTEEETTKEPSEMPSDISVSPMEIQPVASTGELPAEKPDPLLATIGEMFAVSRKSLPTDEPEDEDQRKRSTEDNLELLLSPPEVDAASVTFDALDEPITAEDTESIKKKKRKRRKIHTPVKKRSLQSTDVQIIPRMSERDRTITGDFIGTDTETASIHLSDWLDLEEVSSEESSEESMASEPQPTIDRQMYYELYAMYEKRHQREKYKNNFLQKKLGDYYKKRRMDHALRDSESQFDTVKKYEQQLDMLEQLTDAAANEELRMHMEIADLRSTRDKKREEIETQFRMMQEAEMQLGKELLTSEEGKGNVDKIVERLLKHQKQQLAQVIKMRLNYIKIRNKLNEKQDTLNALDNLGPNLHLIDYEQLKFDNRTLRDKLEERENELLRLRSKCKNAMQILAHRREKAAAIDEDILVLRERLEEVTVEHEDAREQLNEMKQDRDTLRHRINKMNEDAGLLTKRLLLKDMELAVRQVNGMADTLDEYKREYELTKKRVNNLRKNLGSNSKMEFFKALAKGDITQEEDGLGYKWSTEVSYI